MKKYKVLRDCIVYNEMGFTRKYFNKGDIVDLEDSIEPIIHFERISKDPIEKKEQGESFSGLQQKQKEASNPKTGFAKSLSSIEPEVKPLKSKK